MRLVVRTTPRPIGQRRRILVLKLDQLGDLVIAIPALRKLRNAFPSDEITLVCGSWNRTLAESLHLFDHVFTHDHQPRNARLPGAAPSESMDHFQSLLSGAYDLALDLKVDADTRVFLTRVDAATKCGFGSADKFPYLDVALPLGAGRVAVTGVGPDVYAFAPADFFSRVPGNALFLETDFTRTDSCIIYGPYAALPRGNYIARFYIAAVGGASHGLVSSITFEVAQDEKRLASRQVTRWKGRSDLRSGMIAIPFSNDDPDGLLEFRVVTKGRPYAGCLRFFGVNVESTLDRDDAPQRRPDRLHVGELMSLLVQLVVDRFGPAPSALRIENQVRADGTGNGELELFLRLGRSILIAPFSNKATREWPLSHYADLVEKISTTFDDPVGLLGAVEHFEALDAIARGHAGRHIYNLAGKTEWSELPRLFERARIVVSNNSGVAHLAAACGAPLVAIYSGAVLSEEWGPRGENTVITLTVDVPCSPCGYDALEQCAYEHRCMRLISVESVFAELLKLLGTMPSCATARNPQR